MRKNIFYDLLVNVYDCMGGRRTFIVIDHTAEKTNERSGGEKDNFILFFSLELGQGSIGTFS